MNRPTLWPIARRGIFGSSQPHPDMVIRKTGMLSIQPSNTLADATTKEISFKEALRIAAQSKQTLDAVQRLRGLRLAQSSTVLQVERVGKKRVFRLYGPAVEVEQLAA